MQIKTGVWYQLVLTSGPRPDGQKGQQDAVYLGEVFAGTQGTLHLPDAHKKWLTMIAKVTATDVLSGDQFRVNVKGATVGGCPKIQGAAESKVDMHVQDFALFAKALGRDELRFLTKAAYQYSKTG